MSLAVVVEVGRGDATHRVTAALGLLLTGALLLAALEQSSSGNGGHCWISLGGAAAVAAWCLFLLRRQGRRPALRLQVTPEGLLRLAGAGGSEAVDAVVLHAWRLGGLIVLRVAAQSGCDAGPSGAGERQPALVFGSVDCLFVLARGSYDENRWHALRRWLVWYRRSRRHEPAAA